MCLGPKQTRYLIELGLSNLRLLAVYSHFLMPVASQVEELRQSQLKSLVPLLKLIDHRLPDAKITV
jgi:hypothetical protein